MSECHKCGGVGYYLEEFEALGGSYQRPKLCLCPARNRWKDHYPWKKKEESAEENKKDSRSTIKEAGMEFEQAAKGSKLPEDPPF